MGRDKLLLEVGGEPLLNRVHDVLARRCAEVILVGGGPARLEGVRQVQDERIGGLGPLAGIEAGLAAAEYQRVFVAAAVDLAFAKRLARRWPTPTRQQRVEARRLKILDLKAQATIRVGT